VLVGECVVSLNEPSHAGASISNQHPRTVSVRNGFGPAQYGVLLCDRRFTALAAGRRFGKTTVALTLLVLHAASARGALCYYVAPTERQAREVAWRTLKQMVPTDLVSRVRESQLEIELLNGSIIKLHGPQSLRGAGLNFVVLDEAAYMPPEFWPEVVRPMLADRKGKALLCSTPKGRNHFFELFEEAKSRPDWAAFRFSTADGGYVSQEELELLKSSMDPVTFAQEVEASFARQQGLVYHCFSRDQNVRDVPLVTGPRLLVGMDFNVGLMTAVVAQKVNSECYVSDEVVLENSNTTEMMQELVRRYPHHRGVVHPDPSGAARKSCAPMGVTDHVIIRQFDWDVFSHKAYPIVDRINSVNAMFKAADGTSRLFVDRKCKHLIRALENLTYKPGTNLADKSMNLNHICDALGYLVMNLFPMYSDTFTVIPQLI
jgi:hypothetical protein